MRIVSGVGGLDWSLGVIGRSGGFMVVVCGGLIGVGSDWCVGVIGMLE